MGGAAAAGRAVGDERLREGGGVMYAHKGGNIKKQERLSIARTVHLGLSMHAVSVPTHANEQKLSVPQ